jgi:hypothetical protein
MRHPVRHPAPNGQSVYTPFRRKPVRNDSRNRSPEEAALPISWIVIGGLYAAWILQEAAGTWSDSSPGLRIYHAVGFLSGGALVFLGARQLFRPVRNRLVRSAAFVLPALLLANHSWAWLDNVLLCASPG